MKISVIIPAYKTQQYLSQCVDSVLAQTYTDIEVILVDDGSPDSSPLPCDEYAQKDARLFNMQSKRTQTLLAGTIRKSSNNMLPIKSLSK